MSEADRGVSPPTRQGALGAARATDGGSSRGGAHLALAAVPFLVILAVLLAGASSTALAPRGLFASPWELLGWILLGVLCAVHRPFADSAASGEFRISLGLGAAILPPVAMRLGIVPCALVAGAVLLVVDRLHRVAERRTPSRASREVAPSRVAADVALVVVAALFAAVVDRRWAGAGDSWPRASVAAAALVAVLAIAALFRARRATGDSFDATDALSTAAPLTVDALAWWLGTHLAILATVVGWQRLWVVWAALGLVAAEAARVAYLRRRSDHRIGDFERLHQAHERILGEISGMGGIAQQILVECRNVLPVEWYQFELQLADGWHSWCAGPAAAVAEGRPQPPSRPGMLPGIHRRVDWRIVEQSLLRPDAHNGGHSSAQGADGELGMIRLWCDPRRIEPSAIELLASLIPQMASSVQRALLDREAKIDALTGVPVRRVLERRLQLAFDSVHEDGAPMAVIMCDIDHFKKVNDTFGHAAGDEALVAVARALDEHRREDDLCCRYGGEEFTVLLERTAGDRALRLAERLRRAVEALDVEYDGQQIPLTLSLGVASFPELHIKTASELLLLADEALYEAKERGRNRCLLHRGHGAFRGVAS